ncbi:heavy metal translocatin [Phellopilus nigrolimitatus]|nr:heavy metal translocatin [Phellopilus nigrolimitatus]
MSSVNTTLLVSNLHCSSCVNTIRETLSSLSPPPISLHTSIVSQSVSVKHSPDLNADAIKGALDEAGFDLVSTPQLESYRIGRSPSYFSDRLSRKKQKHAEQCLLCQEAPADSHEQIETLVEEYSKVTSPVDKPVPRQERGPYRATFSVGGMTCASCVGNVTHVASDVQGISDVEVNLIGKSATAKLESKDLVKAFVEAVEDGGYEATLVSIDPVLQEKEDAEDRGLRTVSLRVDGMFCNHCPEKIMKALDVFGEKITVDEPLKYSNDSKPIFQLTYTPSLPDFTLRHIIAAISSAKSPPFDVTIAKPASLEERARLLHAQEQRRLLLRFVSAVVVAIPTFIIGIVYMSLVPKTDATRMWFMRPMWTGNASRAQWALFFLATPVMFFSAGQFHRRSLKELYALWRRGSKTPVWRRFVRFGSMNLLVSMGVSIAYFASIALLALAAIQSPDPNGQGNNTTYFDSVVLLTMFLLAGRFLEAYSKGRTADAVSALGQLRPSEALLLGTDEETSSEKPGMRMQKVKVDLLEIGDIVRVPHGATPPTDGVIESRDGSQFDESSLTGESKPIKKGRGDQVFVGTINRGKAVDVKITTLGGETMLDQIVKVVREGQTKRAPIEKLADVITGFFVPVITLLAVLTWIIWLVLGLSGALPQSYLDIPVGGWPVWALEFAIAVFVVACPCGVGLAAPTALLVGSGLAAKHGILVRGGGEAFQEAAQLDAIVFDKTGTLTEGGEPRVTGVDVQTAGTPWSRDAVLSIAHALESASSHPLAVAVRNYCEAQEGVRLSATSASAVEETAGRGLKGSFVAPKCDAIIGNEQWMVEHGATLSAAQETQLEQWKVEGKSVVSVALTDVSGKYFIAAIFATSDQLRAEASDVVYALQAQGLGTWMISGDNPTTAKAVAKSVGIPETNVIAGVLPQQKAEKIQWIQRVGVKRELSKWKRLLRIKRLNEQRCIVAMVGDGINDAPALAAADVGIAVGSGSDVAISSASFILIKSDLRSLLTLTDLSRKVFNRVKFNFLWAVMYNLAALPIAAGVIYPAGHARLDPVWASLAMALSSVSVVLSSLMLRLYRSPKLSRET